jgi:hypothetical protein
MELPLSPPRVFEALQEEKTGRAAQVTLAAEAS